MGWLMAVTTVLQLLPTLIKSVQEIVRAVESDDTPGMGAEKKQHAMSILRTGMDAADSLCTPDSMPDARIKETTLSVCSGLIDSQVAFDKALGKSKPHHLEMPTKQ